MGCELCLTHKGEASTKTKSMTSIRCDPDNVLAMTQRRGPYRKTAARREQLLDSAFEVFARSGYSASSMNEIARMSGITQAGILHHFKGGKPELLRAVLERRDAIAQEFLQGRHGLDFLLGLVEISRQQGRQPGMVQLYKGLSTEAIDPDHPAHEYFRSRLKMILGELERAYREIADEGQLREGVSPELAALDSMVAVEGIELVWLTGLDVDMGEYVRRRMTQYLTVGLPLPAEEAV